MKKKCIAFSQRFSSLSCFGLSYFRIAGRPQHSSISYFAGTDLIIIELVFFFYKFSQQ